MKGGTLHHWFSRQHDEASSLQGCNPDQRARLTHCYPSRGNPLLLMEPLRADQRQCFFCWAKWERLQDGYTIRLNFPTFLRSIGIIYETFRNILTLPLSHRTVRIR
jgi:hypothetical protein